MSALNRVIEQVAYKQVEDMIVYLEMLSEQIIETSKTARTNSISFSTPATSNSDLNKRLVESRAIILKLQDDYKSLQKGYDELTKKVEGYSRAKAKMSQEGRNAIIDAREERKVLDGNAVANSSLTSYIQKLSVERAKAARTVADYNAQIKMGIPLTDQQNQELVKAEKVFKKYDNAIKAGKQSVGDYRERVGQYERANVGLKNSINQITRELPAATFGFQTFALGISNNVPILWDEITSLTKVMEKNALATKALANEKTLAEQIASDAKNASEEASQAQTIAETALAEAENIATAAAERQALAAEALTVAQTSATATSQTQALAEAELTAATLAADAALELQIIAEGELTAASAAATAASQRLTVAEAELAAATTAANASQAATPSILSRVTSALFSFNTLMSVGLLLVALYGKEISNWFTSLFNGEQTLNDATKALIEFQKAQSKGTENTKNELQIYKQYLEIASGITGDKRKQKTAIDFLRSSYPGYLKALSDEQIIKLKGSKIDLEIQRTLGAGEQYKTHLQEVKNVNERIEAYKLEIKEREKYNSALEDQYKIMRANPPQQDDSGIAGRKINTPTYNAAVAEIDKIKEREKLRKESIKDEVIQTATTNQLKNSLIELNKVYKNSLEDSQELKNESILLEYTDTEAKERNTKAIKLNTKAREDYLASEYELWRLRKTNQANANKDIMEDEATGYELRLIASEQYYQNTLELANREAQEELRVLEFTTNEKNKAIENDFTNKKEQLKAQLDDERISRQFFNQQLKIYEDELNYDKTGIIKDYTKKQNIIFENQKKRILQLNLELVGAMQRAWNSINFKKAELEIDQTSLENLEKIGEMLNGIGKDMPVEEIERQLEKINKLQDDYNRKTQLSNLQLELDTLEANKRRLTSEIEASGKIMGLSDAEIEAKKVNNLELLTLEDDIIKKKGEVLNATIENNKKELEDENKKARDKKALNETIYNEAVELAMALKDLANTVFENNISRYDREIQASNDYYDNLLANAENGSEQEKLLEEEKQRREEEIQRRKIELQRKQAIFNKFLALLDIGVNLQRELAANTASLGTVAGNLLNPLAIASAGVRVAAVLATPLPQYEKGRFGGPEEEAIINEKRIEPVVSTDGTVKIYSGKNRIVNLKKDDIVYPSMEAFQKSKLSLNNAAIMASFASQNNQLQMFDYYFGKEFIGIADKIESGIEKGFKKLKNNIVINNKIEAPRRSSTFFN